MGAIAMLDLILIWVGIGKPPIVIAEPRRLLIAARPYLGSIGWHSLGDYWGIFHLGKTCWIL